MPNFKNFTTFKYVNELSNDIEDLENQLDQLKREKESYDGQDNQIDLQRRSSQKKFEVHPINSRTNFKRPTKNQITMKSNLMKISNWSIR